MKTILCGVFDGHAPVKKVMPMIDNQDSNVLRTLYLTPNRMLEIRTYRFDGLNFHRTRIPIETAGEFL